MSGFEPVYDSRKQRIRGLCKRGDRFYAQIRVDAGNGKTKPRRIPLKVSTVAEARNALEKLRVEKREGNLAAGGRRPTFEAMAQAYLAGAKSAQKKKGTRENEAQALARWIKHLGPVRLDKITPAHIHDFHDRRLVGEYSDGKPKTPRTVNLDTVAFRNVLKFAVERGHITKLPEVKQLKQKPPEKRTLLTAEEFTRLLDAASVTKNAIQFRHYLRFLALTGAREQEALQVRWPDVDISRDIVTIGAGGVAKNHRQRSVDFSPALKVLMAEMQATRVPDSDWLFPSPQRGKRDVRTMSFRVSLKLTRDKAGLQWVGFHDLRHMFASRCVMAGLDYMTIAEWLGHSDGGILVGKVYGHLADTHKRAAAQKL